MPPIDLFDLFGLLAKPSSLFELAVISAVLAPFVVGFAILQSARFAAWKRRRAVRKALASFLTSISL